MITTIPDRERALQAQVDALTEELASVEASNRIRGDELARLRDEMSKMQQHATPPADIISRAVSNAKYWMDRAEHAEAELERLRAVEPVAWKHDCAGLCTNDVELWIDACPHCGKPRAAPPAQPAEPVQPPSHDISCMHKCTWPDCTVAEPVQRLTLAQATAPREIWLQISDEQDDNGEPFPDNTEGITWCQDSVLACEVKYVRADIAIESALQPGWRDIESAPKDGSTVIVGRDMGHFGFIRGYARWECSIDGLVPGWISCGFDPVNSNLGLAHPTHWQPLPPAPKASHD